MLADPLPCFEEDVFGFEDAGPSGMGVARFPDKEARSPLVGLSTEGAENPENEYAIAAGDVVEGLGGAKVKGAESCAGVFDFDFSGIGARLFFFSASVKFICESRIAASSTELFAPDKTSLMMSLSAAGNISVRRKSFSSIYI